MPGLAEAVAAGRAGRGAGGRRPDDVAEPPPLLVGLHRGVPGSQGGGEVADGTPWRLNGQLLPVADDLGLVDDLGLADLARVIGWDLVPGWRLDRGGRLPLPEMLAADAFAAELPGQVLDAAGLAGPGRGPDLSFIPFEPPPAGMVELVVGQGVPDPGE